MKVIHDKFLVKHPENLTLVPQEFGTGGRTILYESGDVLILYDSCRTLLHEITHYILFSFRREHLHLGLDLLDADNLYILINYIAKSRCNPAKALKSFSERMPEILAKMSEIVDPKAVRIWKIYLQERMKLPHIQALMKCNTRNDVKNLISKII